MKKTLENNIFSKYHGSVTRNILRHQNITTMTEYKTETIPGKPLKRKVTQEETREWKK
jgi:hypothetical protein